MPIDYIFKTDGTDKDYYLMIVDSNGLIHFANSYLISNLGLTHYEIPKYNFFQLLDPDQLNHFKDQLLLAQANDRPVEVEISARNGSFHWIKWEIRKYNSESENGDKFFCIGYDIAGKEKRSEERRVGKECRL